MLILIPSIALNYAAEFLTKIQVNSAMIFTLRFAEYAILIVDHVLLIVFLVNSAVRFIRREVQSHQE